MQDMQRQALERQKMMMGKGGENPWEVGYSQELQKGNEVIEAQDNAMKDSASVLGNTKSYSFWKIKWQEELIALCIRINQAIREQC